MTQADLSFLRPLFHLAGSLVDATDVENMSLGLGEVDTNSAFRRDDQALQGMWVSMVATNGIAVCLDHVVTLRDLVTRDNGTITVNAPWTLLRAALESVSVSVWVMAPTTRLTRQGRALRVWHYDYSERQKWEADSKRVISPPAKSGTERASAVLQLAVGLGVNGSQVVTPIAYADAVAAAAQVVGWEREDARARWREASGFAHGRTWPLLTLTTPTDAQAIYGGVGMSLTLDEARLAPLANLTHDLLNGALLRYAELAAPVGGIAD